MAALRYVLSKYLVVNLVFPTSVFGVGISFCLRHFLIIAYLYRFFLGSNKKIQIISNQFEMAN